MSNCDYLVPRLSGIGIPLDKGDCGECLLHEGHTGEHLIKTDIGFFLWQPQEDFCFTDGRVCDCDYVECYVYHPIADKEAHKLLTKSTTS